MTRPTARELTLEDKARLLTGRDFWSTHPIDHAAIPSIVLTDGPHGVRRQPQGSDHLGMHGSEPATCFPPAVAIGSSWDPNVAEQLGAAVGREARALGVHVLLGPGVNIKRSPLCGRNFEYYSEDPLLAGALGAAHVRGQQKQGVGASVKHFAANNQETERLRVSAEVDERTLREIYLPAFERIVVEAAPATVMSSYNRVNGVFASENRWLLTDVLRSDWGFPGAVVSDWGAVQDPVASVRAGLDLQMPGTAAATAAKRLVGAVGAGELEESVLDAAVERVLRLAELATEPSGDVDGVAHHALARELATDCAVLLKNDDDVLPLTGRLRVAVIGEFARTPRFQGGGSSHVNAAVVDVPLEAMRAMIRDDDGEIRFAPGFRLDGSEDAALRSEAVSLARDCDVAVVFAGLAESDESEGFDRAALDLPATQVELIKAVAAAGRVVVVLANGGVVTVDDWQQEVDAILEGFLLGQAGGGAITDLLFGVANPSGRLAESIPTRLNETATYLNFPGEQGHVRYGEGVMVGYRWHETAGRPARYPFGYGLSYTTFALTDLTVEVVDADIVDVTVTVTNTGDRAGSEVIQLYVATTAGPVRRPTRELRAFEKVRVEPGESRLVTMRLGRRAFAYWDVERSDWVVPAGSYVLQACRDSATVLLEQPVTLTGDVLVHALTLQSTVDEWLSSPVAGPSLLAALASGDPVGQGLPPITPELLRVIGSMPMQKVVDMLGGAVHESTFELLMASSRAESHDRETL